ncbi:MAG: hypothetical protein FWF33_00535 [Clostridiales bacterium]|nr:hypothetical protein [Clostridiales bacterium]
MLITKTTGDELTPEESKLIDELLKLCGKKRTRNLLRNRYYDGKVLAKNLGVSLPNNLVSLTEVCSGWGAKAVDALAVRSRFDGFAYPGRIEDPLTSVLRENNFYDLYRQTTTSELTNSCAFLTVSAGDPDEDEPHVIISAYSARNAAALWDSRKKRIKAGIVITKYSDTPSLSGLLQAPITLKPPTAVILYTDTDTIECSLAGRAWRVTRTENNFGRPLMEALIYKPTLEKPFGTSRISRASMSIIDRAIRCAVRMDIAAEFFSAPQKYLLGGEEDKVRKQSKWDAYIGNIFGIGRDENGDLPVYGQLPQMQLTPLTEQMRSLAAEFSGETSVPISSLGVIHDNPTSAEAIYAAKEDLIMEAEKLNDTNGNALKNIALIALAIKGECRSIWDMPDKWLGVMPRFRSPARLSMAAQSDALMKQVTAIPWLGETDVVLEELGYTGDQIMRMKSQRISAKAAGTFGEIAQQVADNEQNQTPAQPEGVQ